MLSTGRRDDCHAIGNGKRDEASLSEALNVVVERSEMMRIADRKDCDAVLLHFADQLLSRRGDRDLRKTVVGVDPQEARRSILNFWDGRAVQVATP